MLPWRILIEDWTSNEESKSMRLASPIASWLYYGHLLARCIVFVRQNRSQQSSMQISINIMSAIRTSRRRWHIYVREEHQDIHVAQP